MEESGIWNSIFTLSLKSENKNDIMIAERLRLQKKGAIGYGSKIPHDKRGKYLCCEEKHYRLHLDKCKVGGVGSDLSGYGGNL